MQEHFLATAGIHNNNKDWARIVWNNPCPYDRSINTSMYKTFFPILWQLLCVHAIAAFVLPAHHPRVSFVSD